jgi:hypothetical protein
MMKTPCPIHRATGSLSAQTPPFHLLLKGPKPALAGLSLAIVLLAPQSLLMAAGPAAVNLRSTASFTILAATTITTTGGGAINGDVGVSPGTGAGIHITHPQVTGTIYAVDAAGPPASVIAPAFLDTAMGDLTKAYIQARDAVPVPVGAFLNPGAGNIGGMTLGPGLYKFDGTALITGTSVTLTGGPTDVWIFQVATDLQVGNGIQVILAGGAKPYNIFWQIGTSAVLGTTTDFQGTILADQSITMNTGSTLNGRALASKGAVTYNGTGGSLPVPETPRFLAISRTTVGDVNLELETTPFFEVTLESSTTLLPNSWSVIHQETPDISVLSYTDPAATATGPKRFYRASLTPH